MEAATSLSASRPSSISCASLISTNCFLPVTGLVAQAMAEAAHRATPQMHAVRTICGFIRGSWVTVYARGSPNRGLSAAAFCGGVTEDPLSDTPPGHRRSAIGYPPRPQDGSLLPPHRPVDDPSTGNRQST